MKKLFVLFMLVGCKQPPSVWNKYACVWNSSGNHDTAGVCIVDKRPVTCVWVKSTSTVYCDTPTEKP